MAVDGDEPVLIVGKAVQPRSDQLRKRNHSVHVDLTAIGQYERAAAYE